MTDIELVSDVLKRGKINYTIREWHSKESNECGKFINITQGKDEIYIEFDSDGKVIENYD